MDDILKRFESSLSTEQEDDQSFKTLYKNWGKFGNQEQRRIEILKHQKSKRRNKLDNCRGIFNLIESAQEKSTIFDRSYQAIYRPNVYVPGFTKRSNHFSNILMQSEWLVEKPEDFVTNWYVTPCPKGTRVLVVACSGTTKFYTKFGQFKFATSTLLPGGNHQQGKKHSSIVDGFYDRDNNTLHVLDILSWNNHVMADGEMEFRHFWLKTKFDEEPGFEKVTKKNKIKFLLLPMTPCDPDSLQKFMMTVPPEDIKLDGLLFYHKQGHYVPGETPLVGWLYPYMVPEVLGVDICIHPKYAAEKPKDYVDQATFIQIFEEKAKKKKPFKKGNKKPKSGNVTTENNNTEASMEADDCPNEPETESVIEDDQQTIEDGTVKGDAVSAETMESENSEETRTESPQVQNPTNANSSLVDPSQSTLELHPIISYYYFRALFNCRQSNK